MTDSDSSLSPTRIRLGLAAAFVVCVVAAEVTDATAPALGLTTAFDVQAAIVGTFIVALGGVHVTHAEEAAHRVGGEEMEVSVTDIQRAGAVTALGGFVVLAVAFI